jgi:hypothetical protein
MKILHDAMNFISQSGINQSKENKNNYIFQQVTPIPATGTLVATLIVNP